MPDIEDKSWLEKSLEDPDVRQVYEEERAKLIAEDEAEHISCDEHCGCAALRCCWCDEIQPDRGLNV